MYSGWSTSPNEGQGQKSRPMSEIEWDATPVNQHDMIRRRNGPVTEFLISNIMSDYECLANQYVATLPTLPRKLGLIGRN